MIGSEELIAILGPRPHSKSVEYDEFISAAWRPDDGATPAVDAAAATSAAEPAAGPTTP